MAESFFIGILCITLLFFICAFLGIGIVITFNALKEKFFSKSSAPSPVKLNASNKPKKQRSLPKKPIKSIEINPDDFDKIYFKKTS